MAAKMRMAARNRGIEIAISARSEGEIANYRNDIDALMVGPHLSGYIDDLKERYKEDFAVILMKKEYYANLDGDKAVDHLLEELENYSKSK